MIKAEALQARLIIDTEEDIIISETNPQVIIIISECHTEDKIIIQIELTTGNKCSEFNLDTQPED